MASTHSHTAFDRIPLEIWEQVAETLPVKSLSSFVLCCRKFYKSGNPYLYRTVYYAGTVRGDFYVLSPDSCYTIHRTQSWLFSSDHSSRIIYPEVFLHSITTNPELRSYITAASFEWQDPPNTQNMILAKECFEQLKTSLSLMRLALPDFDTKLAISSNVTFLDIVYPNPDMLRDLHNPNTDHPYEGFRDSVYSIFCIPTLRHLVLRSVLTWNIFSPLLPTDKSRVGTSNIISLSLLDTVPLSKDLEEILTWPKALRGLDHENRLHGKILLWEYGSTQVTSPKTFINGLYSQRHTLEELYFNNMETEGTDETKFGTALREFINLKRMVVTRSCLVDDGQYEELQPPMLHETLPPNLEQAWIEVDGNDLYAVKQHSNLKRGLLGIARNKEQYFPSLKSLVLWTEPWGSECDGTFPEKEREIASEILNIFDLVSTFQEVGVQFNFIFGYPSPAELGNWGWID